MKFLPLGRFTFHERDFCEIKSLAGFGHKITLIIATSCVISSLIRYQNGDYLGVLGSAFVSLCPFSCSSIRILGWWSQTSFYLI